MASTQSLIELIKFELKAAGISYAELARELDLSESSVKRMFASGGEMPLSRIDEICRVLHCDFADLTSRLGRTKPALQQLTIEQERAVVAEEKLLLVALCCLSQWSFEQIVKAYRISDAEATQALVQLDHLGIIELRPLNRYKLRLAKTFRWQPQGPVMQFFRDDAVQDYFSGGFDGDGELLMLVHGQLGHGKVRELVERLQRVAEDFARQHMADQKLPESEKRAFTLVLGMRNWLFERLRHLLRQDPGQR
ncbi:helix-turn-helix transcriptional regulator [Paucibacter sp. R3-3]|uniref:Helix-turn-helix transcriptional regulator n=1 Tax=Roseateles agri TaxID=3098619 RepID=A0ABU5DEM4_9BURK|nr:helix-turn-helix transcriptional regulator [Paucibacter sp. R3-3]MDY0744718.1 helix-turn-helix transcriptional regulator [Paucibacter sp. R3-3]